VIVYFIETCWYIWLLIPFQKIASSKNKHQVCFLFLKTVYGFISGSNPLDNKLILVFNDGWKSVLFPFTLHLLWFLYAVLMHGKHRFMGCFKSVTVQRGILRLSIAEAE
jgi:hypothetical protein